MKKQLNQNILITGGTGFVGAHVVEHLLDAGARVVSTYQTQDPSSYFFQKKLEKKTVLAHVDVRDERELFHVMTRYDIQYVLHLAAQPLVDVAYANPMHTIDVNVMGTTAILEAARKTPTMQGIIVASSDKAYGKHGKTKYIETDRLQGDHPYEVSKSAADLICTSYMKTYHLPIVVTRFGNIYGEGDMNFSRIIPGMMQSILSKKTLRLRSDGTYVRDYLYVKDVARGYGELLSQFEKAKGQSYNFGSLETLSVIELIAEVEKALHKKIQYSIEKTAQNEIPYQSLDFSKIKNDIGWKPKGTVRKTIPAIYEWYRKCLT